MGGRRGQEPVVTNGSQCRWRLCCIDDHAHSARCSFWLHPEPPMESLALGVGVGVHCGHRTSGDA